jgi:hypothetical protein
MDEELELQDFDHFEDDVSDGSGVSASYDSEEENELEVEEEDIEIGKKRKLQIL